MLSASLMSEEESGSMLVELISGMVVTVDSYFTLSFLIGSLILTICLIAAVILIIKKSRNALPRKKGIDNDRKDLKK